MRDTPRTRRTPSLCRLPPSCAGHLGAGDATPVSLGGTDTWGYPAYALQLAEGLACKRVGGAVLRPPRRRTCQAHRRAVVDCRTNRTRVTVHAGADRPKAARNPPRCAPVQSRLFVNQPEKARFILYPNAAFVEKKRCPGQLEAAWET